MKKDLTPYEILNEIKLRMNYDPNKTLSENKENFLDEADKIDAVTSSTKRYFNVKTEQDWVTNFYPNLDSKDPKFVLPKGINRNGNTQDNMKVSPQGFNMIRIKIPSGTTVKEPRSWNPGGEKTYKLEKDELGYIKVKETTWSYVFPPEYKCVTDGKKSVNQDKTIVYSKDGYNFFDNGRFYDSSTKKSGIYNC